MTHAIPTDFRKNASEENDRELGDRYGQSAKVIRRWRRDVGVESPARRVASRLPDDFPQQAHRTNGDLARHYGVGEKVVRRFRKEANQGLGSSKDVDIA